MMKRHALGWMFILIGLLPLAGWTSTGSYTMAPASGKYSAALGLNNAGVFTVNNRDTTVPYRIGSLSISATSESVGTLGGSDSVIFGFNNHNEAVGLSTTADGAQHAFLYTAGHLRALTAQYGIGTARAINDRGDIAGESAPEGRQGRAFVLHAGKVDVFGPPNSTVVDINIAGDVVRLDPVPAVPEAPGWTMLLAGAAPLAGRWVLKRKPGRLTPPRAQAPH